MIELQRVRVPHVEAVPGAGRVVVVARVVGHQAVVRRVVDALERQHRAEVVALGGVVVDDVENHLDALLVERAHHRLELLHLLAALSGARVLVVRREETDRVVAPVVAQPALDQLRVVHELVDRQELDRRDAERAEVVDRDGMREAGVGAAERARGCRDAAP